MTKGRPRLVEERLRRRWSQRDLADKLGTTFVSISRWERGINEPSSYFRQQIGELFEKSAEELDFLLAIVESPVFEDEVQVQAVEASSEQQKKEISATPEQQHEPGTDSAMEDLLAPLADSGASSISSLSPLEMQPSSLLMAQHPRERNQARMIELVASIWITGMLEQSLHGATLQALGLYERPQVITNPWALLLQELERPEQLLPRGTSIAQVYDATGGHLLLLGEPGSGKTTLLLELARTLLSRARQDSRHPIPVVFNLSSWVVKQQSLERWMVDELQEKYQVPRTLGKQWIDADAIIPLLDGLDEVAAPYRSLCIEVLNRYRQNHGLLPTVVCSRYADYLAQNKHILLRSAVVLQPLNSQQISDYLADFGAQVEGLRRALDEDEELQKLATTPLMLSVLTLTYHGVPQSDVMMVMKTQEIRRRYIFERYVERMLRHRSASHHYTTQQTMSWLIELARQLTNHQETAFYIERIQFDWLSPSRIRHLLPAVSVGLMQGLFIGIVFTLFCLLFHSLKSSLIIGGVLTLWNVGFSSMLNGIILEWQYRSDQSEPIQKRYSLTDASIKLLSNHVIYGIVFVILNNLCIGLMFGLLADLRMTLLDALRYGVFYSFLIGGAFLAQGPIVSTIRPAETVTWSWKTVQHNAIKYMAIGVAIGLIYGLIYPPIVTVVIVLFAIVGSLLASGVSNKALEPHQRLRPNQGIRRSGRNSFQTGIVAGGFTMLMLSFSFGYFYGPFTGLFYSLIPALSVGICLTSQRGGTAYLLHFIVRGLLWWEGKLPWNYAQFLDEAADRIILRKVGGGYIFIHRYVLEYFASLERATPALTEEQRQIRRRILQGSVAFATGGAITWLTAIDLIPTPVGTPLYVYVKHTGPVNTIAISPDSMLVVSGSDDTTMRIWEATTGRDLSVFYGQVSITTLAWSPDGLWIAIGKENGVLHLWDVRKNMLLQTYTDQINAGALKDICWSPDGQMLATLSNSGSLRIWQIRDQQTIVFLAGKANAEGRMITWSPDNSKLAFVATDKTIHIWHIHQQRYEEALATAGDLRSIAWSPDGRTIAACVYQGWVQTWNALTHQKKNVYTTALPETSCVCWSPDSQRLLTSQGHQSLQVWDVHQETALLIIFDQGGVVQDAQYAPDGTFFASAIADTTVRIWQAR